MLPGEIPLTTLVHTPVSVLVVTELGQETIGRESSLRMVPSPWLSTMVSDVGVGLVLARALDKLTKNVSSGSHCRSPMTWTVICPDNWPAGMVNVPLVAR